MKIINSTFDLKDKINASLGRETRVEWNKRKLDEYFIYLRGLEFQGLDGILDEAVFLWESGLYKQFMLSYEPSFKVATERVFTEEEALKNRLLSLAREYLSPSGARTVSLKITDQNVFKSLHNMIETAYFFNYQSSFIWNDILNIYFGGLPERLILGLEKFDEFSHTPQPTNEFFQKLAKTQITQKDTYDLNQKMFFLLMHIEDTIFGHNFGDFNEEYRPTEGHFIRLLAGCSAAHNNREFTAPEDIIMAYKTFFKLIKTDITVYKAPQSIIDSIPEFTGYLVCDKCGVSHGLGPEDSADDFDDICDCGGHLVYQESI